MITYNHLASTQCPSQLLIYITYNKMFDFSVENEIKKYVLFIDIHLHNIYLI